jgi:hypothetical protein
LTAQMLIELLEMQDDLAEQEAAERVKFIL